MTHVPKVNIYTDGACKGNPGQGGYGVAVIHADHRKELSGGYRKTTNNRMELLAAIIGLEVLDSPCEVILYSDSKYLVNAMEQGWARRWQANGWRRANKEKALNSDLWYRLLELCKHHAVKFQWVKGHAGNFENERCDYLATTAAERTDLPSDEIYEGLSQEQMYSLL